MKKPDPPAKPPRTLRVEVRSTTTLVTCPRIVIPPPKHMGTLRVDVRITTEHVTLRVPQVEPTPPTPPITLRVPRDPEQEEGGR